MRERFGTASEPHLLAEVIPPLAADTTLATGYTDLECNAVTNIKAGDVRPDGNDGSRGLMAQRKGLTGTKVTVGELLVVGHIRSTDSCGLDGNL